MFSRLFTLVALLGIFLPLGVRTQQTPRAGSEQAITLALRQRQFDRALELIRPEIQRSPKDAKLWALQGIALSGLGRAKQALAAYENSLKISPAYLPSLEGAAELEYEAGSNRATPLLEHILKLQPDNSTAHAMLGVLAYKRHDCGVAVSHFRAAQKIIASQPVALAEFGACLVDLQQEEQAIPIFQQLLALKADDSHARYNLAVIQLRTHHAQEAIAALQPLLQLSDPDADTLDLASSAYEEAGDTPTAVKLLRQAIIQDPKKVKYYIDFATISFAHRSFEVGVDMLDLGLKQNPNEAVLYVARGILYIQLGQYDRGESDFASANRLDPRQTSGAVAEGLAQIQQSNLAQALDTIRSYLKSHPDDAFLNYLEAQALFQQGIDPGTLEFKQAVAAAELSVKLSPDFVLARDLLGSLYLKSGDIARSIAQSRRALRDNPADQEAIYHLIQALRKSEDKHTNEELPGLVKRLAALRQESRKAEASGNRYKLYEVPEGNESGK